ncbi:MAG: YceI family protein [Sphingomonadales bacterium]|nr:YceI family protein [Sphingomonadales bacterium]
MFRGLIAFAALAVIIGAVFTAAAQSDWMLDADASRLSFGSEKNGAVGEVHHFTRIDGVVGADGQFSLTIDLSSVETWADIRNERMLEFLFEVTRYPEAMLTGTVDLTGFDDLAEGASREANLIGTLSLHGLEQELDLFVIVTRLAEDRVLVVPDQLVILNAGDFDFGVGVEKLRELAGLDSISLAVPVSFYLVFER